MGVASEAGQGSAGTERRSRPWPPLRVEWLGGERLATILGEWAELCGRTLEPNVFLEPTFALPLMQHVSASRRLTIVLVWEEGETARLLALLPVAAPRSLTGLVRAFKDEQAPLGTPLLDAERGAEALSAMLAALASRWPRAQAAVFTRLPREGAVASLLRSRMPKPTLLCEDERVVLPAPDATMQRKPSAKRRKELARQRRRLAGLGTVAYVSHRSGEAISKAAEDFLVLEQGGWKGGQGTALLSRPSSAAFARAALQGMAEAGLCRIDALTLDETPLAMGIVLTVRGRAHWWKTAYDERFAALSPGVHFAADLTRRQHGDPSVVLTDSCSVADHPMIGRLWPGRMTVVDYAVALRPTHGAAFGRALALERVRLAVRAWAKTRWHAIRRR